MSDSKAFRDDTLAIIGVGCRFPGGVHDLESYWSLLSSGTDAISRVPADRFDHERYASRDRKLAGHTYCLDAGIIDGVKEFDPAFFGMSRKEAQSLDPQQRLILELVWEALEHAHIRPSSLRGSNASVFIGASNMDTSLQSPDDPPVTGPYSMTGSTLSIIANRVSYILDLHGPSMTIDTACSSSLVAVHQACEALRSGRTDVAIAGGVNILLAPYPFIGFSQARMLSPDGRCKVFDASGNGYVRSEGAGIVIIKSLRQARRDGDRVLALIAGSGVNSDGKTTGIALPNDKAQAALLQEVYRCFRLSPDKLVYVEAHGTGTAAGDPLEAAAIGSVLGRSVQGRRLAVGSAKGNIGHLEPAAGMAGLLKGLLVLQKGQIPPNLHFTEPNPAIDFAGLNIEVPTGLRDVTDLGGGELVSVNSFGFGGTNAHVVLRKSDEPAPEPGPRPEQPAPLLLSAKSRASLQSLAGRYRDSVARLGQSGWYDLAASTAFCREEFSFRSVVHAPSFQERLDILNNLARKGGREGDIEEAVASAKGGIFAFSGNGSQWLGMGRDLLRTDDAFRNAVMEVDRLLSAYQDWSVLEVLESPEAYPDAIAATEMSQPLLFAVQVGLVRALEEKGVVPSAVFGHSVGEVAAAWASGALSLEDAVTVIHFRSLLQAATRDAGGMAVASLPEEDARAICDSCDGIVSVAAVNTGSSLTIAGEEKALKAFLDACKKRRIAARMLQIPYPFHTSMMDGMEDALKTALSGIKARKPKIPFYSTVAGKAISRPLDREYWWRNIRFPVLFGSACQSAIEDGFRHFLEIGPSPILRGYIRDAFRGRNERHFIGTSLSRDGDGPSDLGKAWQGAWKGGWPLALKKLYPLPYQRPDLPSYPWDREYLWSDDTPECRGFLKAGRKHPLLGWQLPLDAPVFENVLALADTPWLADHVAGNNVAFPAAAFLESMLAAGSEVFGRERQELERVNIFRPLILPREGGKVLRTSVDREDGGILVESRGYMAAEPWGTYARGRVLPVAETPMPEELNLGKPESFGMPIEKGALYEAANRFMLHYGPAFRTVDKAWVRSGSSHPEVLARLAEPDEASARGMNVPPPLLDGAFQTLFILLGTKNRGETHAYLPSAFERVVLFQKGIPQYALARLERMSPRSVVASFRLLDDAGNTLLLLSNCRFRRAAWLEHEKVRSEAYSQELVPSPHPDDLQELNGVTVRCLKKEAESCLEEQGKAARSEESGVHPYLLQQLVALSAAHETILALGKGGEDSQIIIPAELVESGRLAESMLPWICHLLERLEAAGLAAGGDGRWTVSPLGNRPSARMLWRTLLSTAPGYLTEAAMLAQVFDQRYDLLCGLRDNNEEAILSPRLVEGYFSASATFSPLNRLLSRLVRKVFGSAGIGRAVNVLQIGRESTALLNGIVPYLERGPVTYSVAMGNAATAESCRIQYSGHPQLEFPVLDPEAVPDSHKGRYHFLIANCGLHSCQNSAATLAGYRELLAPGGVLCVLEHAPTMFADYVLGARPSWWSMSDRPDQPVSLLQNHQHWLGTVRQAGFSDVSFSGDGLGTCSPGFVLLGCKDATGDSVSPPAEDASPAQAGSGRWLLVNGAEGSDAFRLGEQLASELQGKGLELIKLAPGKRLGRSAVFNPLDSGSWAEILALTGPTDIVYLSGYDRRTELATDQLADVEERGVLGLAALAKAREQGKLGERIWILTAGSIIDGLPGLRPVPSQGALCGFSRVMRNEMRGVPIRLLDIHDETMEENPALLVQELLHPTEDTEVVFASGLRAVPRLKRILIAERGDEESGSCAQLAFDMPGRLQNLYWRKGEIPRPGKDEICVEVRCTGLNFRDVMWSMGMLLDEALENGFSGPGMGIECSGVISAVGRNVKDWQVGDEVVCFAPACFSTHVLTTPAALTRKPSTLSFAEAATIPVTFITAWYSLKHLANMQPGERVLIHGAAGGVGLAAIQIANHLGLEVYATAGSPEKHQFLRQLGVVRLYSSRSLAFAKEIMEDTGGEGVDAVLNSLSGEAIAAGLSVLRPFGRFLELGKRDFYADTPMRLRPFSNNLSYFGVDVDQLLVHQPILAKRLFSDLMRLFAERQLVPLPHTVYPASRTVEAFQAMQQATHIGKLVISLADARKRAAPARGELRKLRLRDDATYLVTGGTSGFGLATAERLVKRGARHLVLLSRSGIKGEDGQKAVEAMRAKGVAVTVIKADVAKDDKLKRSLNRYLKDKPPLRGIVHAAAVLDDGMISGLTDERIRTAMAAKSLGAWNLHQYSRNRELDFFVLYSSATTAFGNPGQASYVAANCMLESLAAWRRSQKLPAQVIGWGPIADTGMLTRNAKAEQMLLKILGVSPTTSRDALYWLEHAVAADIEASHYFGLDWETRADLPALSDSRFAYLRPASQGRDNAGSVSLAEVLSLPPDQAVSAIAGMLVDEVSHVLRMPKDSLRTDTPLVSQGMDSLMAVELALSIEQKFDLAGYSMPLSENTTALSLAESLHATLTGQGSEGEADEGGSGLLSSLERQHGVHLSDSDKSDVLQSIGGIHG